MADEKTGLSEDDLLANAIPIEDLEELEEIEEVETEETEAPKASERIRSPREAEVEAIDLAETQEEGEARKITTFGIQQRHDAQWSRTPNVTGQGAIHVKTFVAKLRLDAIDNLDQDVNKWLDAHPEYEVKLVTTSVGVLTGKMKEDALFLNVWV